MWWWRSLLFLCGCSCVLFTILLSTAVGQDPAELFSGVHCIGGVDSGDWMRRSCALTRVCLINGSLHAFSRKPQLRWGSDGAQHLFGPNSPLAALMTPTKGVAPVTVIETSGKVPGNQAFSDAPVSFLFDPFWPENWGHVLGNDFLAAFQALDAFSIRLRKDVQYVSLRTCAERYSFCNKRCKQWQSQCRRNYANFIVGMSSRPLLYLSEMGNKCFEKLVVGSGTWTFRETNPTTIREFRNFVLANLGVSHELRAPNLTPCVCLFHKTGRRRFKNFEAVQRHLVRNYRTNLFANPESMSFRQQAEFLSQCTVVVSPSGSLSMVNVFLPLSSALITVDYFDPIAEQSTSMEGVLWSKIGWIREMHYRVKMDEVDISEAPLSLANASKYRDYGNVYVDIKRLSHMVDDALDWVKSMKH